MLLFVVGVASDGGSDRYLVFGCILKSGVLVSASFVVAFFVVYLSYS